MDLEKLVADTKEQLKKDNKPDALGFFMFGEIPVVYRKIPKWEWDEKLQLLSKTQPDGTWTEEALALAVEKMLLTEALVTPKFEEIDFDKEGAGLYELINSNIQKFNGFVPTTIPQTL